MNTNIDYTPKKIDEIVYHSITERQQIMNIATGKVQFPVSGKNGILLYGIYGTGKTTLARLLPDAIEQGKGGMGAYYNFLACEQGQNGAKFIAGLRDRAQLISPNDSGYHYFVLDEVDNLTDAALASLKTAMGILNTIFIMTTNHISKIDRGVLNRCERINFNAADIREWLPFARRVLNDCGAGHVSDDKLLPVIISCDGSAREIASAMQRIAAVKSQETAVAVV
jgi:DNA polymerase III delta prime subunit